MIFAGEALSRLSGQAMGEARARAASALDSGEALEAFRRMVEAQGGDPHVVDDPEGVLPASPVRTVIASDRSGTLAAVDAEALGRASGDLGAGRRRKGDPIDPAVGVVFHPKIGDPVERGQELGNVHAQDRRGRRTMRRGDPRSHDDRRGARRTAAARLRLARMTSLSLRFAAYLGVSLVVAVVVHEYAHAFVATRRGDPNPRRWGRLTLNPKPLIDPFGTVILPVLALILVATRGDLLLPVFAYAKPMPLDPSALRNPKRDQLWVAGAGLVANVLLAVPAGLLIRAGASGDLRLFASSWVLVNAFMFGLQLMPIPGLDGAKLLAPFLPPRPREVFMNLEQYLVLFILVIFFLLSGPLLPIVNAFGNIACNLAAGTDCF